MIKYLTEKGYQVNVVTGFPSYPQWKIREDYQDKTTFFFEEHDNCKIYRYKQYVPARPSFIKRILLLLDFSMGSFVNIFKIKECDMVISVVPHTSTLLLGWILKARTKAKLWNHIQDFEFDAVSETGISSKNNIIKKLFFKVLFSIETKLLNQGNINSTISYKMLSNLEKKSKQETFYFPNWIDAFTIDPVKSKAHSYLSSEKFKILYSGNIGDKQDWDFFMTLAEKLKTLDVEIVIVGDGAKREWLCSNIKCFDFIKYFEPVKYEELSSLLCAADLHVLFQKNSVIDSVMPSKLLGMMASSRPSLITGNEKSEVKEIIEQSNGGFYISNNDVEKCFTIVEDLIQNPNKVIKIGLNAREFIINKFSADNVLNKFESKLSELIRN